eukprot:9010314-Pyramimonas_sp.AAC.1
MSSLFSLQAAMGHAPSPLRILLVQLFQKPETGRRPIGFFQSYSRIYSKVSAGFCKEWETQLEDGGVFNMAPRRSTTDGVWRQAVRSALADESGMKVGMLLADLLQCYEHVRHLSLWEECKLADFPLHVLRTAISSYRWPRVIMMDRVCSPLLYPDQGIVAGSSTATFEIKAFMVPMVQDLEPIENTSFTIHVDDLEVDGAHREVAGCLNCIAQMAGQLFSACANRLGLPISLKKGCFTSNSKEVMEGAQECFGQYAHTLTGEVVNLGVDFSIGSKVSRLPNEVHSVKGPRVCSKKVPNLAKRRSRWSKALRRMPKIRNLRGKAGSKAKLFFVGQKPSMTYGSDVVGLGPREVHKLRVLGAKALGIWCPGASIDLIWATESSKDPINHAGDTIVRYAREWWEATDPQLRASDGLSAGTLTKAFHACLETLVATPPSLGWRRRGTHPILDALLWGVEAGWIFNNQASFTSASGVPVGMTDSPPELVRKIFVQDLKQKYLAESVNKIVQDWDHPRVLEIQERGLWTQPIRSRMRSKG